MITSLPKDSSSSSRAEQAHLVRYPQTTQQGISSSASNGSGGSSGTYELCNELQQKQIELLNRKYGGHLRARRAARIIQLAYREYRMRKNYEKLCENSIKRRSLEMPDPAVLRKLYFYNGPSSVGQQKQQNKQQPTSAEHGAQQANFNRFSQNVDLPSVDFEHLVERLKVNGEADRVASDQENDNEEERVDYNDDDDHELHKQSRNNDELSEHLYAVVSSPPFVRDLPEIGYKSLPTKSQIVQEDTDADDERHQCRYKHHYQQQNHNQHQHRSASSRITAATHRSNTPKLIERANADTSVKHMKQKQHEKLDKAVYAAAAAVMSARPTSQGTQVSASVGATSSTSLPSSPISALNKPADCVLSDRNNNLNKIDLKEAAAIVSPSPRSTRQTLADTTRIVTAATSDDKLNKEKSTSTASKSQIQQPSSAATSSQLRHLLSSIKMSSSSKNSNIQKQQQQQQQQKSSQLHDQQLQSQLQKQQRIATMPKTSYDINKRKYLVGLNLFNRKPERGIAYLMDERFLEYNPRCVAEFLFNRNCLSKQMIGEYIGNTQDKFARLVLQ
jgi:hypothetical protein